MRTLLTLLIAGLASCSTPVAAEPYHLIPGTFVANKGPDGNSIFLDAPDGLILVDTGRHPAHRDKLLAYAKSRARPIVAIFNTHWHLDHTTGNAEIRAAYPKAPVIGTGAIEGALVGFFPNSRKGAEDYLKSGKVSAEQRAEIERGFYVMDHPDALRATRVIDRSGDLTIGGRRLLVNVARFAATEGDLWLYDPKDKVAIVGDLVVASVPFMDTACADGWKEALADVAATPWTTLIPGHGAPMNRDQFNRWRRAFEALVDCGRSAQPVSVCADAWVAGARPFIAREDDARMKGMVDYYVKSRLRSSPEEQQKYCRPLKPS